MAERELLLSRGYSIQPVFWLIDFDGNRVADVSDRFISQGSYIRRDSTARIDGSATFNFVDVADFDFGRHMLAVNIAVTDTFGDEGTRHYRMGNWVMQPPTIRLAAVDPEIGAGNEMVSIECRDPVSLLATRLENVFAVSPGTNVITAIGNLLQRHGIVGLSGVVDEDGNALTIGREIATYGNWDILKNNTYLDVCNQLLELSAHVGLYTDRDGRLASYPWRPIQEVPPKWDFDYERDGGSGITGDTIMLGVEEQVPNVWVGFSTPLDQATGSIMRTLELRPGSKSPYSIEAQGGRRNPRILKLQVSSTEELEASLLQVREEDITRSEQVEIHCGPLPLLWQADVARVNIPQLGLVRRLGVVREWTFPFDYAAEGAVYTVDLTPDGYANL